MATITTKHGTFSAPTMREARRAAQEAASAAYKEATEEKWRKNLLAWDRAKLTAYKVLTAYLEPETSECPWDRTPADRPHCGARQEYCEHCGDRRVWVVDYVTKNGMARGEHHVHTPVAIVTDGQGMDRVVFLRDNVHGEVRGYAIGVEEGVLALEEMPACITPEMFPVETEA